MSEKSLTIIATKGTLDWAYPLLFCPLLQRRWDTT